MEGRDTSVLMEYVTEGDRLVVRLDPRDRVLDSLERLREQEDITSGYFFGIGAVDRVTLGHYNVANQDYKEKTFEDQFEVTGFSGNIGPDKIHAHIQLGKQDFSSLGGHCSGARVSGTFELVVFLGETPLTHQRDQETGLDVFEL
jgi:predicted DNA-binding protein with PD1-like motif